MRRDYISPEFDYTRTFGTYDMTESSSLFGSKMLEIEDELDLHNQSIIYYQNLQKEQIDFSTDWFVLYWCEQYHLFGWSQYMFLFCFA